MKKIGIIRCQKTEAMCPSTSCLHVAKEGKVHFKEIGPAEVIGLVSCGGCPGKEILLRALKMIEKGAEVIALSTCIIGKAPAGKHFACPFLAQIKEMLENEIGNKVTIIYGTH
ncbi:Predicted metal-binding protein [Desulfonauticus submarinus]|uniref:Predicted metal-binding protein n=1 Tax=Desulfonauticus submarinus TaxID=206665 RepID=A0A1H0EVH9_9BACT|nr:CGGC domain-containing protein [Desulfonauticus submarinus]SDN86355.1 Predicted metal-binding protein [Desulfonauticus submarinus]